MGPLAGHYYCNVHHAGTPGRPNYCISYEELKFLLDLHFTVPAIAQILGVSPRTIARRLALFNLSVRSRYDHCSDRQLDSLIEAEQLQHPSFGYRMMRSLLFTHGVDIQEKRIRQSMRRVDPLGVAYRWARSIHRRRYRVPCPNSLWHIDSYHALIRWKFVIHGGIDGFSRLIVYLKCSPNNRSDTVFGCFLSACSDLGIPSRVRSDRGGENVKVATFMVLYRGTGRGSHITGTSVHNQRIERLWRDVYVSCINLYYHIFFMMEDAGMLDIENEIQLFSLQYVYLPRINEHLGQFVQSWNCHPLTSSNCLSPCQLWVRGLIDNVNSGHTATEGFFGEDIDLTHLSNNWNVRFPSVESDSIEVDPPTITISDDDIESLISDIQPLRNSECWGIDIYLETVLFLEEL